jgi:dihydroorotate dehydrogenase
MSWLYRSTLRPALFTQDAESIHNRTMRMLNWVSRNELACGAMQSFLGAPELPVNLFGLRFPNPVGLAAGMDKNAEALPAWEAMGLASPNSGQPLGSASLAIRNRAFSALSRKKPS